MEYTEIEKGTIIYAGAILIGGITIGKNCIIRADVFINKNLSLNSAARSNKIISKKQIE